MPFVRIHFTDATCRAIDGLAGRRARAEFVRNAIGRALYEAEEEHTRAAYAAQPDSESEADDWSKCEEFTI